jgi:hypothetical protein
MKLGKLPARPDAVKLKLSTYLKTASLPTPPATFGHDHLVKSWPMLANDQLGDCVIAGGLHESQLWNASAHKTIRVDDHAAIRNYSAITGYDPADPNTDQGTDMQVAASYRRKTGLVDADGKRHKVAAYVALNPGDVDQLYAAMYLFGAVGIGIEFPAYAMDQFNARQSWHVQRVNAAIEGGHYIPGVARASVGLVTVVTWGRAISMTEGFYARYCDEGVAYLSTEMLTNGVSIDGFKLAALQDDLAQVTK